MCPLIESSCAGREPMFNPYRIKIRKSRSMVRFCAKKEGKGPAYTEYAGGVTT